MPLFSPSRRFLSLIFFDTPFRRRFATMPLPLSSDTDAIFCHFHYCFFISAIITPPAAADAD
jgi:hypothetical protein